MNLAIRVFYIVLLVCGFASCKSPVSDYAEIIVKDPTKGTTFIQKQGTMGYEKVVLSPEGEFVYSVTDKNAGYYIFLDSKSQYNYIYLTPGAKVVVENGENGVTFSGDNQKVNEFINDHIYLGHISGETCIPCSSEWIVARDNELNKVMNELETSNLPKEFVESHKWYYRMTDWKQRLYQPSGAVFAGKTASVAPEYYDFMKDIDFSSEYILNQPLWFDVLKNTLEEMEKRGMIEVSLDNFFEVYAQRISNPKVRSHFMYELLNHTLDMGYSDDFPAYMAIAHQQISEQEVLDSLPKLEARFSELQIANASLVRGKKAPEFEARDINGKVYKSSDFIGKVVVLDFWFTGCIPCKAEMPYFTALAEEMSKEDVCFLSMSLDTEGPLLEAWKGMIGGKEGAELYLNVPGGFKSELTSTYLIKGVPRVVLVDKSGNIVDAYAKRPSDPKLRLQLERLVNK